MTACVLVPTRDRPENLQDLIAHWDGDGWVPRCGLRAIVDEDQVELYDPVRPCVQIVVPRLRMVPKLNIAAMQLAEEYEYIGFMGDDHRPRTKGWDIALTGAIDQMGGTGIAYGDDGYQHERIPTSVMMSANIIRALGWMAPPCLDHFFCDDFWRDLGFAIGRLAYLPDVLIEHMHWEVGKSERDDLYRETGPLMVQDRARYAEFHRTGFGDAVERVSALL